MKGKPTFAVLNKNVLALFQSEQVSDAVKTISLKKITNFFLPKNWDNMFCFLVSTDPKAKGFIEEFRVDDPSITALCANSAEERDKWIEATKSFSNCVMKVVEDDSTLVNKFESKRRKKTSASEKTRQELEIQEREYEEKKKESEAQEEEKQQEEYKKLIEKAKKSIQQKQLEKKRKRYEFMAMKSKEEELRRQFSDEDKCLETRIQDEAMQSFDKVTSQIEAETTDKNKQILENMNQGVLSQQDFDRIISRSLQEDALSASEHLKNKMHNLIVQETVKMETLEDPEMCYQESLVSADRKQVMKSVCSNMVGNIFSSENMKIVMDCMKEEKFCKTCCENQIGVAYLDKRYTCELKCKQAMSTGVPTFVNVPVSNLVNNIQNKVSLEGVYDKMKRDQRIEEQGQMYGLRFKENPQKVGEKGTKPMVHHKKKVKLVQTGLSKMLNHGKMVKKLHHKRIKKDLVKTKVENKVMTPEKKSF